MPSGGTVFVPGFGGDVQPPSFLRSFPQPVTVVDYGACVSPADFADRIDQTLRGASPSVVAGHSVGGFLALDAMGRNTWPTVKKLVLFGVGMRMRPPAPLGTVVRLPVPLIYLFLFAYLLAAPYFFLVEGAAARQRFGLFRNLKRLGVAVAARSCRDTLFALRVGRAPARPLTTELVVLRGDILVPEAEVAELQRLLPGSKVTWLTATAIHLTGEVIDSHYQQELQC